MFVRVQDIEEAVPATVLHERRYCRIYELANGLLAKVVKGSGNQANVPRAMRAQVMAWLARSLMAWNRLTRHSHPGLLRVFGMVSDHEGNHGYACERLTVFELEDARHPARESLGAFLRAGIHLASAAGALHRGGIVHGDITPSNVCWRDGLPVLIDLEMSVCYREERSLDPDDSQERIDATPACCAPEQVFCVPLTPSTDVYCCALTLLSWATGITGVTRAFWGQTVAQTFALCERAEYPHWELARARIREPMVLAVLERALNLVPCDRQEDGNALARELQDCLESLGDEDLSQPLDGNVETDWEDEANASLSS